MGIETTRRKKSKETNKQQRQI